MNSTPNIQMIILTSAYIIFPIGRNELNQEVTLSLITKTSANSWLPTGKG